MADIVLDVEKLSIAFGQDDPGDGPRDRAIRPTPVREVTFKVERAQAVALVGESGCGKSLTSLAAIGLIPSTGMVSGGSIRFGGSDLSHLEKSELQALRGSRVSMIFQEPMTSLNPVFTVGFHLAEALKAHTGLRRAEIRRRSLELLAEVGISDGERRLDAYPHELSGGLRQRVMIACAISCGPELLIADEPTTALDVTVEAQIMSLLGTLRREREMSLLLVTHDLGLVAHHAERVVVMYAGYVVEDCSVLELFDQPLHPYSKAFLEAMPRGGKDEKLKPIPGTVPNPFELGAGCPFCDRCPVEMERCSQSVPPLEKHGNRAVRCFRVARNV